MKLYDYAYVVGVGGGIAAGVGTYSVNPTLAALQFGVAAGIALLAIISAIRGK